jgi:hypothetical protein
VSVGMAITGPLFEPDDIDGLKSTFQSMGKCSYSSIRHNN